MKHDEARALIGHSAKLADDIVMIRDVFGHLALVEREDGKRERVDLRLLLAAE